MKDSRLILHVTDDPMYGENAYTVHFAEGGPCWIIDPGLPPHAEQIVTYVREHRLTPEKIVLTHGHADHIAGIDDVGAWGASSSVTVKPEPAARREAGAAVASAVPFGPKMRMGHPLTGILAPDLAVSLARLWLTGGKRPANIAGPRQAIPGWETTELPPF